MKCLIFALLLALLLTGCAGKPAPAFPTEATDETRSEAPATAAPTQPAAPTTASEAPTTVEPTAAPTAPATAAPTVPATAAPVTLTENSAWTAYGTDEDALAVIVNAPFSQELPATVTWFEGEYEQAYIIPRYVGSYVNLYPITWDEETFAEIIGDEAAKSVLADDGCIIYSELVRPEGMAFWYLEVTAPDGAAAGLVLSYNGNTGTPPEEFLHPDAG